MTPSGSEAAKLALPGSEFADPDQAGVLLVGHGTRELAGQQEFLALAAQVSERLHPTPVEPCFLEFAEPTIFAGLERLAERGSREVVVAPVLLFAAGHANHDIPAAVRNACRVVENRLGVVVAWRQASHLGCHPNILRLSLAREREALGVAGRSPGHWARLLVGRGSREPSATEEMRDFALRRDQVPHLVGETESFPSDRRHAGAEVCFVAMAEPRLADSLERLARSGARRVLVEPHLLFAGRLISEIEERVATAAKQCPDIEFLVAERLGPDRLVVEALRDRIAEGAENEARLNRRLGKPDGSRHAPQFAGGAG